MMRALRTRIGEPPQQTCCVSGHSVLADNSESAALLFDPGSTVALIQSRASPARNSLIVVPDEWKHGRAL